MWGVLLALILLSPGLAWAQGVVMSGPKGASGQLPITGTSVDADHSALDVYMRGGSISVSPTVSGTSSLSNVSASASNVTCLAAAGTRVAATLYNDSTAIAYVKLGTTASSTSFTVKLYPEGYFTVPGSYTGKIDCIWASATGAMRVTELTP